MAKGDFDIFMEVYDMIIEVGRLGTAIIKTPEGKFIFKGKIERRKE